MQEISKELNKEKKEKCIYRGSQRNGKILRWQFLT